MIHLNILNYLGQLIIEKGFLLIDRLEKMHQTMKDALMQLFNKVEYFCTTADVWTSHNRSFLGMRAHWIDDQTLVRKSAAVACMRLKGHHTYDVIAAAIETIHTKYQIEKKVVLTVTDNGSNFAKAFKEYSEEFEENAQASLNTSQIDHVNQTRLMQENKGEVVFIEIDSILDDAVSSEHEYTLPPHQRCGAHTMNLIAVHDTVAANKDAAYKKVSRSALGKCSALLNKASRSPIAAEDVYAAVKCALIVPNTTRWNSFYDAVNKVADIVKKYSERTLNELCTSLEIVQFRPSDVTFIQEYCKVMQPVAQALDILQTETKCFMGVLLPTVVSLKKQLHKIRDVVKVTIPLTDAILAGIDKRYNDYFSRSDLILSSITHPQFRMRWIEEPNKKEEARLLLKKDIQKE